MFHVVPQHVHPIAVNFSTFKPAEEKKGNFRIIHSDIVNRKLFVKYFATLNPVFPFPIPQY